MSRRLDQFNFGVDGDMSTSFNTVAVDLAVYESFCVQAVWTGAPVGALKIQISNVIAEDSTDIDESDWSDYSGTQQSISMDGNFIWEVTQQDYRWVRLVYIRTSGTGTLTRATFSARNS